MIPQPTYKAQVEAAIILQKEWLTVHEAGLLLGCKREAVYKLINDGTIGHSKPGKCLLVSRKDINRHINDCAIKSNAEMETIANNITKHKK